jgi:hypothetical protein
MFYDSDDYAPLATMSDAHSEWHRNAGVPMGQAGCPQDACDPGMYDYLDEDPAESAGEPPVPANGYGFPDYPWASQEDPPF